MIQTTNALLQQQKKPRNQPAISGEITSTNEDHLDQDLEILINLYNSPFSTQFPLFNNSTKKAIDNVIPSHSPSSLSNDILKRILDEFQLGFISQSKLWVI